jgi:tetratricopeptide (TPR) repeat protein
VAGEIAGRTGNPQLVEAARQAHQHATTAAPQFWVHWRALAATDYNLGDYAGAQLALSRSLKLWDKDAVTWALVGDTAAASGDTPAARAAYERALTLDPADERAKRALTALGSS